MRMGTSSSGRPGGPLLSLGLASLMLLPLLQGCAVSKALYRAAFLRSGAPSKDEIRRMEERERIMLRRLTESSILVLPVGVLGREVQYRPQTARQLSRMLRDAGIPGARASTRTYVLPFPRQPNEAWLYWKRFRALGDSIRTSPPDPTRPNEVDYILLMDVLGGVGESGELLGVGAVHLMSTTGEGELVYGSLRNSHHEIFQEIQPRSMEDACRLAVQDLLRAREEEIGGGT